MTPLTASRNDTHIHTTILSTLAAEHTAGRGILAFLDTKEASTLRLVNDEFREAVALFPWFDMKPKISNLQKWRACFPNARAANICGQRHLVDADFVHLKGIHTLYMWDCNQAGITDKAFENLKGIDTLDMSFCTQAGVTDAAFANLNGIHTLVMDGCHQITDAAFAHLKGIHTLDMSYCNRGGITDAAFENLRGIHTLGITGCAQFTASKIIEHLGHQTRMMG